jgi:hypothetical protein
MKKILYVVALVFWIGTSYGQGSKIESIGDFKPSVINQPGQEYPMVNSEGRVRAQILAPDANYVQLDIGGVKYDLVKDENGVWTGESAPQDVGFHYYQLNIDGASVPDPGSLVFFGACRWGSGIEVPAPDQEIFALKNVPHGHVHEILFRRKVPTLRAGPMCTHLLVIKIKKIQSTTLYCTFSMDIAKMKLRGPTRGVPIL